MTRKLIALIAAAALAAPVLGAQQAKGTNKPAAQTAAKPAAMAKNDSTKADSAKSAKKGTSHKSSTKGGKGMAKDSAKGGTKKP